jgi:hypothetical protein
MPIARPLDTNRNTTFGLNGVARLEIGPVVFGETWRIRRMTVSTDSTSNTDVRVYLNAEIDSRMVAGSYSGDRDFNETDITLQTLDKLIVVWVDGTPGSHASFLLQGTSTR